MDSSVICHPEMVQKLSELARERVIPAQMDVIKSGGTDAGSIHTTRMGVLTGGISIPAATSIPRGDGGPWGCGSLRPVGSRFCRGPALS
jgi:hypothetical protein